MLWLSFFCRSFCKALMSSSDRGSSFTVTLSRRPLPLMEDDEEVLAAAAAAAAATAAAATELWLLVFALPAGDVAATVVGGPPPPMGLFLQLADGVMVLLGVALFSWLKKSNKVLALTSFPLMLMCESMTLMSGTAPSSSDVSLLRSSSKNSSPVTGCKQEERRETY